MNNKTMKDLGRLYRALTDACSPRGANQTDLTMAQLHPLRAVSMAITKAHALHSMTPDLDVRTGAVLGEVSLDEMQADFGDKPAFDSGLRAEFMLGYKLGFDDSPAATASGIKQARQAAGLTVRGLAAKVGVSPTTITEVEAGRKTPRADTLRRIADACGTTMDQLWPSEDKKC